ncbi:MAG: YicC/YloC family endoribonuclease [Planctomycetota bacterium]|jgi:uncharacterized protein (TIGR00255 family)
MLKSMTGYGQWEREVGGIIYRVEIKAVNNRYLKMSVKLPEMAAFLEEDIERFIRQNISRGAVSCVVRLKGICACGLYDIDEAALRSYIEKVRTIAGSAGLDCPIEVGSLLALPGILKPALPDSEQAEKIRQAVLEVLEQALGNLRQMRTEEGAVLAADLESNCEQIREVLEKIGGRCDAVVAEYAKKLKRRVDGLLATAELQLNEETLAREVAVFAERMDISEELSRLDSHISQFIESLKSPEAVGRKLDFISQEMLREANTIGSKASDSQIADWVVDIKCRIERIKEQVQNVE